MLLRGVALIAVLSRRLRGAAAGTFYNETDAMTALSFSKAAYCQIKDITTKWDCGPACDYNAGFQLEGAYAIKGIDSQGYAGYDPMSNRIVAAFRGSFNLQNWISDFTFAKVNYTSHPDCGCEVHKGFYAEWNSMAKDILKGVSVLHQRHPSADVLVTGHSLGAAVSILAALDVAKFITPKVTLYNFGEPRVGDAAFAKYTTTVLPGGKQFRLTHKQDPVPHIPLIKWGFLHAPHEVWYDNDGHTSFTECNDSATAEATNCSDKTEDINVFDHVNYLGVCAKCEAKCII